MQPKYYGAAANYNNGGGFKFDRRIAMLAGLGLVVFILIIVVFTFISSLNSAPRDQAAKLVVREQKLQLYIATNQKKIINEDLAKVSGDANLLFTTDYGSLLAQYKKDHNAKGEISKEVLAAEADTTTVKALAAADINDNYDQVYLDILRDKIAATASLARSQQSNASESYKTTLTQIIANLDTVDKLLAKLKL